MAIINLFNRTFKGSVIMTGNSIGISTATGTQIGAFSIGLPTNTPPNGTTTTVSSSDSSSAKLTLPSTATVRAAFLLWSATSSNPGNSIGNGNQNNNVTLRDPLGNVNTISPAVPYRQLNGTISTSSFSAYSNAADVTSIVATAKSGFYTIGGVLGVTGGNGEHNGWILIVAYEDSTEVFRNINIWTALDLVAGGSTPSNVDITISGFSTPSQGPTNGKMIISAGNGNAELSGESTLFGPTIANLATLSGPNNPATNFFASQINDNLGALDKTGTFGNNNSTPGSLTPIGVRNNWDVTRVDASAGLTNNQMSGIIRFRTIQDTLFITGVGLQVDVNSANLTPLTKSVDKTYAQLGDTLTYTITTTNAGLVTALNTIIMDTLPSSVNFVSGSFKINGSPTVSNPTIQPGVNIGNIGINQTVTLTFNVLVVSTPSSNTISNSAGLGYSFIPASGLETIAANQMSSIATTTLVNASLTKFVDATISSCGKSLTYTNVYNFTSGPSTVNNIIFSDTIPTNTTFQTGSVFVNTINFSALNPTPPGFTVNNGLALSTATPLTITHKVTLNTVVDTTTIPNQSTGSFQFFNGVAAETVTLTSNTVNTTFNPFCANIYKSVDKAYADIGDILTYTLTIPNNGTTLTNIVFKDTIPTGTSFINDSFTIDGVTIPSGNPNSGISISDIPQSSIRTITFQVRVTTIPSTNPIPNSGNLAFKYTLTSPNDSSQSLNSNIALTKVNNGDLSGVKYVNKAFANIGDILTYTIVFYNVGNVTTENVILQDGDPQGTTFVTGTFTENGVSRPLVNPNSSPLLGNIGIGKTSTISFQVKVITLPSPNPIPNAAKAIYTFFYSPDQTGKSSSVTTNIVYTQINNSNLSNISKSTDKSYATCGDTITYTILIPNTGSVTAQNIVFKDTVPNGTTFINGSVFINNIPSSTANPATGISIPNIAPGATASLQFSVKVIC